MQAIFRAGKNGGRGGIRTHGRDEPTLDFESSAFNRTQPPFLKNEFRPRPLSEGGRISKKEDSVTIRAIFKDGFGGMSHG
jgi:hypothetical protein